MSSDGGTTVLRLASTMCAREEISCMRSVNAVLRRLRLDHGSEERLSPRPEIEDWEAGKAYVLGSMGYRGFVLVWRALCWSTLILSVR